MGSLNLPARGDVYIDTQAIVYGVEHHVTYPPLLAPLWTAHQSGAITIVTSHLSLMEYLVMPLRNHDVMLVADFERTFQSPGVRVMPIDDAVLRKAAQLRADLKTLRTPDAIHAATSLHAGASLFVTNDRGFRVVQGLPLALLDDILTSP